MSGSAAGIFARAARTAPFVLFPGPPGPICVTPMVTSSVQFALVISAGESGPSCAVDLGITALFPAFPGASRALQIIAIPPPFASFASLQIVCQLEVTTTRSFIQIRCSFLL